MSDRSDEPEKYTIDEMMERLKRRSSAGEEKELVTREDGTQAVKSRKRKRRTDQAVNKETKRNQKVHIIQIMGFTLIAVLIFIAGMVGLVYSNSAVFREKLIGKIQVASGAKVEMTEFRMNPASAHSSSIKMTWPEGNVIAGISAERLIAKTALSSFVGQTFSGEEIVADKGNLVLRSPLKGEEARYEKAVEGKLPVHFERYSIPALDVCFGSDEAFKSVLEKTEASYFPIADTGKGEIRLNGGLLRCGDWPTMELDRCYVRVNESELDIQSMRFTVPTELKQRTVDRGWMDFTGVVRPLDPDATHVLNVRVESFRLSYLLGSDLGRFFLGSVMTNEDAVETNFLKFHPELMEEAEMELKLVHSLDSRVDVSQLRFLSNLASYLDDRWFELPNFESEVSFLVRRTGELLEMREINLEQRGRMAIRGELSGLDGGMITGKLRVGIPGNLISGSKNKRLDRIFGEIEEGYRWVDIEIGGTGASPVDNFREMYEAADEDKETEVTGDEEESVEKGVEEGVEEGVEGDSFDELIEGD
jgi:hypothetical protein